MAMVLLAMSVGCGSRLETEAVKRAKEYCKLTQIGGSVYICGVSPAMKKGPEDIKASKTVLELRNFRVEVSPNSLTEADKLNGVEWGGCVRLEAEAYRRYSPQPPHVLAFMAPDKTWSDWLSPTSAKDFMALNLFKTKGEWKVFPLFVPQELGEITSFKQVEASDLP
jgi:hypothetical protein